MVFGYEPGIGLNKVNVDFGECAARVEPSNAFIRGAIKQIYDLKRLNS